MFFLVFFNILHRLVGIRLEWQYLAKVQVLTKPLIFIYPSPTLASYFVYPSFSLPLLSFLLLMISLQELFQYPHTWPYLPVSDYSKEPSWKAIPSLCNTATPATVNIIHFYHPFLPHLSPSLLPFRRTFVFFYCGSLIYGTLFAAELLCDVHDVDCLRSRSMDAVLKAQKETVWVPWPLSAKDDILSSSLFSSLLISPLLSVYFILFYFLMSVRSSMAANNRWDTDRGPTPQSHQTGISLCLSLWLWVNVKVNENECNGVEVSERMEISEREWRSEWVSVLIEIL